MSKKKLLVLRFSALGDVAMIAPVLEEFIKQNPDIEVYMASRPLMGAFFEKNSSIKFIPIDLKNNYKGFFGLIRLYNELKIHKFDYVADLHNVIRSKIITFFFRINGTKTATLDKGRAEKKALVSQQNKIFKQLKLTTERYADVFRKLGFGINLSHQLQLSPQKTEKAIGIAPFAAFKSKMYPIEKIRFIVNKLAKDGYQIFLFGGGKNEIEELKHWEKDNSNIKSLAGTLSLKEELEVIAKLQVMIAMDSANMHLASLVGTRVISIWGGTHPYAGFLGYGQKMEDVIQDETLSCRPTSVFGKDPKEFKDFDYFKNLDENIVYHKIKNLIDF